MEYPFNLNDYRGDAGFVHFIGCGGVGTGPLMRIFHHCGFRVSGSDLEENLQTRLLRSEGMRVEIGHCASNLPPEDGSALLVIYSSAAGENNPELVEGRRRGALCLRRGEALGVMSHIFRRVISVSGSHGKTSVSAMIAYCLKEASWNPGFLIGGMVTDWPLNGECGSGDLFVTEVDESDGTHACTDSFLAVVPNVEDDHAWSVGGTEKLYENFRRYAFKAQHLIYVGGEIPDRIFADHPSAVRLDPDPENNIFSRLFPQKMNFRWGGFQKRNAVTALAALKAVGMEEDEAVRVLSRFPGVERRMSVRYESKFVRVIEDYAHHPTELKASLEALHQTNPGRRLLAVFQPHRYARLDRYFDEFAEILQRADRVFITPVFAAWTQSGPRDGRSLAEAVGQKAVYLDQENWADRSREIAMEIIPGDTIAVIGAGDLKDLIPFLCRDIMEKEKSFDSCFTHKNGSQIVLENIAKHHRKL